MRLPFLSLFILLFSVAMDCSALDFDGPLSHISFSENGSISGAISCGAEGETCILPAYNVTRPEGNCSSSPGGHYKVYYGRTIRTTVDVRGGTKFVVANIKCGAKVAAKDYRFPCTYQFFKEDPWRGKDKFCYYRFYPQGGSYLGVTRSATSIPGNAQTCAAENETCNPEKLVGNLCIRSPKSRVEVYYGRRVDTLGTEAAYQAFDIRCSPWLKHEQFKCSHLYFGVDPYPGRDKFCYVLPVEVR